MKKLALLLCFVGLFACGSEAIKEQSTPNLDVTPPTEMLPPAISSSDTSSTIDLTPPESIGDGDAANDSGPSSDGGENIDGGSTNPPPPSPGEDSGSPPSSATVGGAQIDFTSQDGNTFCYQVTELDGAKDLSHWNIGTNCVVLNGTEPIYDEDDVLLNSIESFETGTDPKSGVKGAKWNVTDSFASGLFCITVDGLPTLSAGEVQTASKSGLPISHGTIVGPVCQ